MFCLSLANQSKFLIQKYPRSSFKRSLTNLESLKVTRAAKLIKQKFLSKTYCWCLCMRNLCLYNEFDVGYVTAVSGLLCVLGKKKTYHSRHYHSFTQTLFHIKTFTADITNFLQYTRASQSTA